MPKSVNGMLMGINAFSSHHEPSVAIEMKRLKMPKTGLKNLVIVCVDNIGSVTQLLFEMQWK